MIKKMLALIVAAMLVMSAPMALAQGNTTIAVYGQSGFEENISGIFVLDGRLILTTERSMYAWTQDSDEMTAVKGYAELESRLTGDDQNPGVLELEDGQYAYFSDGVFMAGNKLYRMAQISGEEEYSSALVELIIDRDGTLSLGETVDLGDMLAIDYGDGNYGMRSLQNACAVDGMLYALSTGGEGDMELLAIDLENGEVDVLYPDMQGETRSITLYKDGKLLMVTWDYEETITCTLNIYDPRSEETTTLGDMPEVSSGLPGAIVYDADGAQIYYAMNGAVYRMPVSESGLGEAAAFGDMPLEIYSAATGVLMDDLYIVGSFEGVVGRDVTIEEAAQEQLRVKNTSNIDAVRKAYYFFTDMHPEYAVNIVNGDTGTILSDMLNRDSGVDIYTARMGESTFEALLNRGFLAELTDSEKLMQRVQSLYPAIRNEAMRDGQLYALPLECYGSGNMAINMKLLQEKFGMDVEIPASWPQLLALVAELSDGRMENVPEASLFESYFDQKSARSQMFYQMLSDYFTWMDQSEGNFSRAGEVLLSLCEAFEAIDWENLGLPEEIDYSAFFRGHESENIILSVGYLSPDRYQDEAFTPVLLSVVEGEEPLMNTVVSVAFVNPFSEHREEAIEFLECALDNMDALQRIRMDPTYNEPIEDAYYEENLRNQTEYIAQAQKAADQAEDEQTREELMINVQGMQEYLDEYMRTERYTVSPERIEEYRGYAQHMAILSFSIWKGDGIDQMTQYLDGAVTKEQLAEMMVKALQMMQLEEN